VFSPATASAAWWNDSWQYRKSIDISNNTTDQTNVYVSVTLDTSTAGRFKANCGDLRFTKANGELLPYLINSGCGTASTVVYVNFDVFPLGQQTIYYYYGNPSAPNGFTLPRTGSVTQANVRLSIVNGTAFADFSSAGTLINNLGSKVVITDSAAKKLTGFIKSAGTGETYGSDLYAGWDFTSGWSAASATIADNNSFANTSAYGYIYKNILSSGALYYGAYTATTGSNLTFWYPTADASKSGSRLSANGVYGYRTALTTTAALINWTVLGTTDVTQLELKQVLTPSATGATIVSTSTGSTYNWASEDSGFNRNDSSNYTYTIYPLAFSTEASSYAAGTIGAEEVGAGPAAYWSFDAGYGTVAQDGSSNNNDGTLTNMSATASSTSGWQAEDNCLAGKCLAFDGINDYVSASDSASLSPVGSTTLVVWVNPRVSIATKAILAKNSSYRLITNASGNVGCQISDGATWQTAATSTSALALNTWSQVVCAYDKNNIKVYINGVQKASGAMTSAIGDNTNALNIGYDASGSYGYFNGKIDEPKIYPYARTAAQIKMDYNVGLAGMSGASAGDGAAVSVGSKSGAWMTNGLVGYWKFDETATTTGAIDWSGNNNTGTYYNHATTTAGKFGTAGSFDGTDDYVDIGTNSALNFGTGNFTLSAWLKRDGDSPGDDYGGAVVSKGSYSSGLAGYSILVSDDGNTLSGHIRQSDNTQYTIGSYIVTDGYWYLATLVRNATDHKVSFYVNGNLVDSQTETSILNLSNSESFRIGGLSELGVNKREFDGSIDETRIYNRALSAREISDLYNYAPGPVGWWKMDERSGQYAYDSSGNGNNGTLGSGATADSADPTWANGKFGAGLKFDGSNDYVDAGNSASLQITGELSISGWVFSSSCDNGGAIVKKLAWGSLGGYELAIAGQGKFGVWLRSSGTNLIILATPAGACVAKQWQHIAMTFDKNYKVSIYVNGVVVKTGTATGGISDSGSSATFGTADDWWGVKYNGLIDDVRIYNYARTQKQIEEDMNARGTAAEGGEGAAAVSAAGKTNVLYYKFDEGYGTTAYDASPNKINGVISGFLASSTPNGKFGRALSLNGSSGVVTVTNTTAIDLNDNLADGFTISTWVNPASAGEASNGQIFSKGAGNYLRVGSLAGGRLNVGAGVDLTTTDIAATTTSAIATGVWSQVVMTFASSTQQVQIYINGALKTTSAAGVGPPAAESNNLLIGGTTTNNFDGLIDEFKIYNYALTADEVKIDYDNGAGLKLGSFSTSASGVASSSAASIYCVPGSSDPCSPPVGEWSFDEGSGLSAYDRSGNGNTGTLTNGPTWTTGKIGKALKFDGVNDYVDLGNGKFDYSVVTICAWFKSNGLTPNGRVVTSGSENTNKWMLGFSGVAGGGGSYLVMTNTSTSHATAASNIKMDDSLWHFACGINNPESLYINGILQTSTVTDSWSFEVNSKIGARGASYLFKGLIDDVKIYNYARTPAQVAWEYNQGGPVGWWKMDECQGGVIHDSSKNKNNGTLFVGTGGTQTATSTCASSTPAGPWYNGRVGKRNASLNFDGTDDYVNQPTSVSGVQSVSFWAYPISNSQSFLQLATGVSVSSSGGTVSATGFTSPTIYVNGIANAKVKANAWNHLSVTTGTAITSNAIKLGLVGSTYYSGQLDDVQIFNYALTAQQVKTLYTGGAVRFGP